MISQKKFLVAIFFLLNLFNYVHAKDIGLVESIQGKVFNKTTDNEIIELDAITLNNKYQLDKASNLTISLDDGTVFIFSAGTIFEFQEYEDIFSPQPHFTLKVFEGEFTVETGELPKLAYNATTIKTPSGILTLNGTAVSGSFGASGQSEIFLLTDSFGNKGELSLTTENGETINVEPDAGVSVSESGIQPQPVSENLNSKMEEMKNTIVETAIVDDKKIEEMIAKKVSNGKIDDLNGDGVIDDKDADLLKSSLMNKKEAKLNAIVKQTSNDPTLLTKIIDKVPEDKAGGVLEKIINENPKATSKVVAGVLENNSEKFNALAASNKELGEKIINTVVKEADDNDTSLSKIIAKSDGELSSNLLKNVSEKKSELLVKIVSEASAAEPEKFSNLLAQNADLNSKVTSTMAEKILEDPEGAAKLKELIVKGNSQISSLIIENVEKTNSKITETALTAAIVENREEMVKKLTESVNENSALSNKIIAESIKQGDQSLVQESAKILAQPSNSVNSAEKNISTNNETTTQVQQQQTNTIENSKPTDLVDKLSNAINQTIAEVQIKNPEILKNNNIVLQLQENLVSPN